MTTVRRVFRGQDRRLRAGWRIILFLLILGVVSTTATLVLRYSVGPAPGDPATAGVLKGLLACAASTVTVFLAGKYLDHRPFSALGLRGGGAVSDLLVGFLLSAACVAATVAFLIAAGWVRIEFAGLPLPRLLELLAGTGLTVAWWEELVFRGYLLQNLVDGLGVRAAVLISCLLYGSVHLLNPGATFVSAGVIAAIGLLRIFGYLRTGQLWLSMGMHAGWNFFQGPVFGLPVSGRSSPQSLVGSGLTGPSWATGGDFGLEASVFGLVYVLAGVAGIAVWTRRVRQGGPAR